MPGVQYGSNTRCNLRLFQKKTTDESGGLVDLDALAGFIKRPQVVITRRWKAYINIFKF